MQSRIRLRLRARDSYASRSNCRVGSFRWLADVIAVITETRSRKPAAQGHQVAVHLKIGEHP